MLLYVHELSHGGPLTSVGSGAAGVEDQSKEATSGEVRSPAAYSCWALMKVGEFASM